MESSLKMGEFGNSQEPNEFSKKYQEINNKLKKRFLRNPNVLEAIEQLTSLAVQCEREEAWQNAGLCYLSVSRCYQAYGNVAGEINYLMKAGKYFLSADEQNKKSGCPSIELEDLQTASSCFHDVIGLSENEPEFKAMAAGMVVQLAEAIGATPAGGFLLRTSIGIFPTIMTIDKLVMCLINQGDYETALTTVTEFINLIGPVYSTLPKYYQRFLRKAEINQLFLILMLRRTPQHRLSFADVIEKYTSCEEDVNIGVTFNQDEFLLLQSLVLAWNDQDSQVLLSLENHLWRLIDADQRDLLRTLTRIMANE